MAYILVSAVTQVNKEFCATEEFHVCFKQNSVIDLVGFEAGLVDGVEWGTLHRGTYQARVESES